MPPPFTDLPAIAGRAEPKLRRAFLAAIREAREATDQDALTQALVRGRLPEALETLGMDAGTDVLRADFLTEWRAAFDAAGAATAAEIVLPLPPSLPPSAPGAPAGGPPRRMRFSIVNPRPLRFLEQHGAELVVEITDTTRQALRNSLVEMTRRGWDTRTVQNDLMRHLGLNSRLASANLNFRAGLTAQGLSPSIIDRRVAQHANRLLRFRATMIGRTESKLATGNGQQVAWAEAVADGYVDRRTAVVIWDARNEACEICSPMDGQERTLEELANGELFVTGDGRLVEFPGETHPQCACSRALRPQGRVVRGRLSEVVRQRAQQRQREAA